MRLADYVLWAPALSKEPRIQFKYQTRSTCALFSQVCDRITTPDTRRVWINCVPSPARDAVVTLVGVTEVDLVVTEDLEAFPAKVGDYKRKRTLELLMQGLEIVAASKGWGMAPFLAARDKVIERQYENRWTVKKKSVDLGITGFLDCNWDCDVFEAVLSIRDKNGVTLASKQALRKPPSEFKFARFVSKLEWEKGALRLLAKDGSVVSSLEVESSKSG